MFARALAAALVLASGLFGAGAHAQTRTAVEYYYAAWDHYFVTAFPDEIAVLDGGAFGGAWKRTGLTYTVWSDASSGALPACRFFSIALAPKSSHFYTPYASECESLKAGAAWQYESVAYYLELPAADGTCAAGTVPLYRLYNNSQGGAPNHRYTASAATFAHMQALGWTMEGDGRTGAFACVPPQPATAEGLWRGTTARGRAVTLVVLEDGTFYAAYSSPAGASIDGGIYGIGTSTGDAFSSVGGRNVPLRSALAGGSPSVTASYVARTSLDAVFGSGPSAENVLMTYDSAYDTVIPLAGLAGTYSGVSGHLLDSFTTVSTIDANGNVTIRGGCTHRGLLTPHGATGIFDLSLINGCLPPGSPAQRGIVIFDAALGTFTAIAPLGDDDMVFAFGKRP